MKWEVTNKSLALHIFVWNNQLPMILKLFWWFGRFRSHFGSLQEKNIACLLKVYLWTRYVLRLYTIQFVCSLFHTSPWLSPLHTHYFAPRLLPEVNQLFILSGKPECRIAGRRYCIYEPLHCPQGWGFFPWAKDSKTRLGLTVFVWQSEF